MAGKGSARRRRVRQLGERRARKPAKPPALSPEQPGRPVRFLFSKDTPAAEVYSHIAAEIAKHRGVPKTP